ncbi:MAG: hypothetical protein PUE95_07470 [Lachnospiraceae bacterium]|nr:hypothetical protein [Lachnospiraceae bacterium]
MDLGDVEFLPIFASDIESIHDQKDLYPIYLMDLEIQEESNDKDVEIENIGNCNLDNVLEKIITRLEKEQICVLADAKSILFDIISEAENGQLFDINNDLSTEEFVTNLYFEAEFILMKKAVDKGKEFSGTDADMLARQFGFEFLNSSELLDVDNSIIFPEVKGDDEKRREEIQKFLVEKQNAVETLNDENKMIASKPNQVISDENGKRVIVENTKDNGGALQNSGQLIYYRLKIKSFRGDLTTLDKDIAQADKYMLHKKALIDVANKNCEKVYSENVSLKEIDAEKRMLESIGFITELDQLSIESNAVISFLYKNGGLIQHYVGAISCQYDFEQMNKMNVAVEEEVIRYAESFEIYVAPAKKVKYTKSGIIKLPFLGGERANLIFTDSRIIVSKAYGGIQKIDKSEVNSVISVFEKKTLSSDYGQVQGTMQNGDILVLVLSRKEYGVNEKDEFDNRVPFLESLIK